MTWYEIIKEYLAIILNWPSLGAVLIFWFIKHFDKEIRVILNKARLNKIGNAEFGQVEIEEASLSKKTLQKPEKNQNWEFKFYNTAIAGATVESLLWLYKAGESSTKLNLYNYMSIPPNTMDVPAEKEAQFSTMLSYKLIEPEGEMFKITKKGIAFLKFNNQI